MAGIFLCLFAVLGMTACQSEKKSKFHSIDISGANYARDWTMPDATGKLRSHSELAGKVVYIFFGYTQCPDVCPTTMADMAQVKKALGPDADKLQIVFVTVDPERDTPEILKAYVSAFDTDAIALAGNAEQLAAMAKEFKAVYQKVPGSTEAAYSMDHSAGGYIYDPSGRIRLYSRYQMPPADLAEDIRQLIHGKAESPPSS